MLQNFTHFLQEMSIQQRSSMASYTIHNQKVWLKKASARHSTWIYLPLSWFAKLLGLHVFRPVPNYGGQQAIQCEINRIQQLSQHGIQVSEILAANDSAVLLKDASQPTQPVYQLEQALKHAPDCTARLSLYGDAVQSIQHIHDVNCYLSEAFARNILVNDQHQFTYIDFETDPHSILSLNECQTRDWLFFIFSTSYHFDLNQLPMVKDILLNNILKNPEVYQLILRVGAKLQWILKLKLEKLGSDGRRLQKGILLLKLLQSTNKPE